MGLHRQLPQPAAGTAAQEPDVVRHLQRISFRGRFRTLEPSPLIADHIEAGVLTQNARP